VPNLSYLSPKTVVKESPIHGRGLFAREPIVTGEIVAIKGGYVFDAQTLRDVAQHLGPAEIPIADSLFIGPLTEHEREGAMLFSNHSCDPNIGIQGQIVFVAMRGIQPGEELTHDWATTDDDTYEMKCYCGADPCRGIITGQDWRREDLQEKYRGYIAWYLQRKIDRRECEWGAAPLSHTWLSNQGLEPTG
jgi:SET domain-containing protein